MFNPVRWSDNDRYLGPFTFAKYSGDYRPIGLELRSGDGDEDLDCYVRLDLFKFAVILILPQILKPKKVLKKSIAQDPQTGKSKYEYTEYQRRSFGFSYHDGYFQVLYGVQTDSSDTEKSKGLFLPWTQWRHTECRYYGLDGELVTAITDAWYMLPAIEKMSYSRSFLFWDFDGERMVAHTNIEENEQRLGEGWFKWLSVLKKPRIARHLNITFSGEVGKKKGSWKGGTIGHSIEMRDGELHEEAFRRYCALNNLQFDYQTNTVADNEARIADPRLHWMFSGPDIDNQTDPINNIPGVLTKLGFEFVSYSVPETNPHLQLIYAHKTDGILLRIDISQEHTVASTSFYYNWTPKLQKHGFSVRALEHGHMLPEDNIWIGRHDGLLYLGKTLYLLRADGVFVTPWKELPNTMRLWHGEDQANRGLDKEQRNEEIIRRLPDWVREMVNPHPRDAETPLT